MTVNTVHDEPQRWTEDDLDGDTASRTGYHHWPWPIYIDAGLR